MTFSGLSVVHRLACCPQCGEDWSWGQTLEFCRRCGSPTPSLGFDPLRISANVRKTSPINLSSKAVVRFGVLGLGIIGLFSGLMLSYGGWVDGSVSDAVQLWVSRLAGPMLILQGFFYCWLPFRKPALAPVIPLRAISDAS